MKANIQPFFDPNTSTITYVVFDRIDGKAAIIDPVWDYDPKAGRTATTSADQVIAFIQENNLQLQWLLETHAHADHLSAAHYLKQKLGGKIAIGEHITIVQGVFKNLFNLEADFALNGSQFDHLFKDGEQFTIGELSAEAMYVPGHTPADMAYKIGDAVFVGDTIFMPDVGTARCDFPGGNVHTLYQSIQKILSLPDETRLFMCHDYPPEGRSAKWQTTVAEQKQHNIHVNNTIGEHEFAAMRSKRDTTLAMPVLILPSVQVNIRAGRLPPAENNGVSYLKIPLNQL